MPYRTVFIIINTIIYCHTYLQTLLQDISVAENLVDDEILMLNHLLKWTEWKTRFENYQEEAQ
jgi:hypothetical protein